MKNLYAAVILAIIVFFLSSCGEGEAVSSVASAESEVPVESKVEVSSTVSDPKEIIKTFTKDEYEVLTDDGLNAVKFTTPPNLRGCKKVKISQ